MRLIFAALLIIYPFLSFAVDLTPQQTKIANEIFTETMSPFCPGRVLQDCPSTAAAELKEQLRERIRTGESKEQLENYLFGLYGEEYRAAPKASGFGLAAWITPPLFLIIGFFLVVNWMKRDRAVPRAKTSSSSLDPEIEKRINQEL